VTDAPADRLGAFLDAYDANPQCTCGDPECAGREDFILGIRAPDGTTRDLYASDLRALRAANKQQAADLATTMPDRERVEESGLDAIGHKWVKTEFGCHGDAKIVTCCGCGFPVDQNHPRCLILDPSAYMGTYGPCCAPTGKKLEKARHKAAKRLAKYGGTTWPDSEADGDA